MRKFVLGVLSVFLILSTGFILYNIQNIKKIDKQIMEKKKDMKNMKKNVLLAENDIKDRTQKYEQFQNTNKDKVEEYEKWKNEVQKIKDLLS